MTAPANSVLVASLKSFSRAAGVFAILVGALALVGWALDVAAFKSVVPSLATMKPNTALAFILAGTSLWLSLTGQTNRRLRWVVRACAVMVALMGLLTLSQDLFGWNLGIDQLLFKESVGSAGTPNPGRMSPATAFNFLLIGCALLLLDVRSRAGWMPAQLFALAAGIIAALALIGYAYSVQSLYRFSPTSSMALHTALAFFVLAAGVLGARPDQGLMRTLTSATAGGVVARRLLPTALGVPFLIGWLRLWGERAGLYENELGVALFAVSNIVIFAFVVFWSAGYLVQMDNKRTRAETALAAKNEEIKAMTQQLWQAARLATMGELAASIAHELNNPLGTVSLRVESLLSQMPPGDPGRRELEVIEQEAERMGTLVAHLLQFNRRGAPQISTVDVGEEIENTLELIHYHLRQRQITVQRESAPDVPMVQADRQQLRQLLLNLFTNAADAMPQGGALTIRVYVQKAESRRQKAEDVLALPSADRLLPSVCIEVADTGTGIAPEDLSRVAEPFFTTKPEGRGTGLGLAICRRIVQEHNGTFEISSAGPGQGTTVRLTLPGKNDSHEVFLEET